jgi:hypothetical protein
MRLALTYMAGAHLALIVALAAFAANAADWTHFYHPQLVGLLHLVTVGWISGSILGMLHVVAPLALRIPLPAGRVDFAFCAGFLAGVVGMAASAWRGNYPGLAAAAVFVLAAIARVGWRVVRALPSSDLPFGVRLHVGLAFANILLAGALGALIGLDRRSPFLPGSPISQAWGHAHLAAIGWAIMMVVGLSYRLIPMMLPAAMPTGRLLARSAWLLQAGVLALVAGHLGDWMWLLPAGALLVAGGLASFVAEVRRLAGSRKAPPVARRRGDPSVWLSHASMIWLVTASALGILLTVLPLSRATIVVGWVYGVAGLIGYLGQVVLGMGGRLFPMLAWYAGMAERGRPPGLSVHDLVVLPLARLVAITWLCGVPALALATAAGVAWLATLAAAAMLAGAAGNAVHIALMVRRAAA